MKSPHLMIALSVSLLVLGAVPLAAAQDDILASAWAAQAPKVDGIPGDWENDPMAVWKKGDVHYAFRNDADNLYVIVTFKNAEFRSTAEATGFTLYFAPAGSEKKDYGVHFLRKRATAEETIAFIEKSEPLTDERKAQMRQTAYYNLYVNDVVGKGPNALPPGLVVRPALFKFASQKKETTFEFALPLARVHEAAAAVGARPGETVTIGFEWGGPTDEQRKQAARAAGNAGIANESITGGGSADQMTRSGGRALPPKYSFWSQVRLALPGGAARPE